MIDIHPTVSNLYTLLSTLPPDRRWYTVLDLKDAVFSLPLAPKIQMYFAFQWHDPEIGVRGQVTWTWLTQGFKNSPAIYDAALQNPNPRCKSVAVVALPDRDRKSAGNPWEPGLHRFSKEGPDLQTCP